MAVADATLVDLEWERIQLICHLRIATGTDPNRLVLASADVEPPDHRMPPTNVARDGDVVRLRFNVMLAAGQMPLKSGTWVLTDGVQPLRLSPEVKIGEAHIRQFAYRGGRYVVEPRLGEEGALELIVANRRRRRRWSRRRVAGWWRRNVRHRLFDTLVRFHRARAPRAGNRIVFTSDSRAGLAGNMADVHARLLARGLDARLQIDTLFKASVAERRTWADRWRLPKLLGQADVIVLDDYQPAIYRLPPDPGVKIVQLWHASGAFKTVGYSRVGKPGGPSPFARRHKNYTHAIVSGRHDVPYYAEAFGIGEGRVIPTGIPRMDRFFDPALRAAGLARTAELFPQSAGRRVILFAPTFRGSGPRNASYAFDLLDLPALHATAAAKDATVLVKMHPFIRQRIAIPAALGDRIVDATDAPIDVNDLLFAVDVLVTDYSSIVFEFATQLRPMLFFAYDLDEYVATRDFYVPFESFVPGRIARTFDDVLAAIRDDDYEADKVEPFARRHFDHLDGSATDRVIDEIILAR